ncbi:glycogen synthase GlgA [Desulfosporosinus metallidurans]|uniref:Glycogen synthase n=1 Tax=Desulfosporosinus metallidurans TaxID=1888891 RepID=A0A1Q8QPX3_9FIRM|nr:glycogen synthase GlgA [Desulfosporosinus metallidurans]OLN29395.1 Glycogen synthase, ADP-glucose transglucosylase [Desulfosporosinus metallidurans]
MNVVFVSAEADPFAKTGGLGEVVGSLPSFLHKQGVDVRVIMPKYSTISECYKTEFRHLAHFAVQVAWRQQYCGLEEVVYQGVHYYFLDNEYYFSRPQVYGEYDDAERFAFFSRAALESLIHIPGFKPDIIHCHDWHTALIPLMLKEFYSREPLYYPLKTVFTIHNLKYQGLFSREVLSDIVGLGQEHFTEDALEFHGAVNFMKAALLHADWITTVSPTYAEEIKNPYYGEKLDGLLRKRGESLTGILNGIDYGVYNPHKDPYLVMPFDNLLLAKQENKKHLQAIMGLPVRDDIAVLGMVSRLADQKGLDLLAHVIEEILSQEVQLVILGTGENRYEEMLRYFASNYPEKLAISLKFSDELAHKIYAGADLFLMPSRFEPCGIAQMIAMRYGTIPVVRETGGLKDTVFSYDEMSGVGNGFSFANYNAHEFLFTVQRALKLYHTDKQVWANLRQKAMEMDFSWERSANAYIEIYESLL